jgi:hypothetical protein
MPVQPPSAPALALEDQRFELDRVAVGAASALPEKVIVDPVSERPAASLHNAAALGAVTRDGAHDLRACVDASQTDAGAAKVQGELSLQLEIDALGQVLGGSTSPGGGESGMAAVADCLLLRARQWRFPARTTPGSTVVIAPYRID